MKDFMIIACFVTGGILLSLSFATAPVWAQLSIASMLCFALVQIISEGV